jgi:bla regulator protein BlaR1
VVVETLFHAGVSNAVSATVLAVVVACLFRPLARRPAVLHWLWFLVLLKLVTPPLYEVPLPRPASWVTNREPVPAADATLALSLAEVETPVEEWVIEPEADGALLPSRTGLVVDGTIAVDAPAIDWPRLAMMIWLGGTTTVLIVSFRRVRRFQRLLGEARPVPEDLQSWVSELASRIGLRHGPVVEWIRAKLSPMIWSLGWRPRLILPRDLWKTLDERQRSTLVVHELAHLRRGDHFLRFFELFVTALFWWHPLVWWVRHALRDAEEQCCDAWVVWAFPDAARSYAETLLETIDFLNHSEGAEPLLASGFGRVHHLRRRLTMILSGTTPRLLGVRGALGLLGLAVLLLPVNATWAQKPEKSEPVQVLVRSPEGLTDVLRTLAIDVPEVAEQAVRQADQVRLVVKTDDTPEIEVAGSLKQAIAQLKKQIAEIAKKDPRSEQDQKRSEALERAIQELRRVAGQIKEADSRPAKPGEREDEKRVRVVRRLELSPQKPLSDEQKAEAEKLRGTVKKLTAELKAKAKELEEARGKLAKLEGVNSTESLVLRLVRQTDGQRLGVGVGHGEGKGLVSPPPVEGQVKRVDPQRRVEISIGSDALVKPGKPIEIKTDHPVSAKVKVPVRSEQQRIAELERTLKKLIGEVENLKKNRPKDPEDR